MVHMALVGITTVIFGIASLVLISKARSRLSDGSIRNYMDNFAVCLAFVVIFSVWQTIRNVYGSSQPVDHATYLTYPEYIFIIFAYVAFTITSIRIQKISREFGFKDDGKKIAQLLIEKSNKPTKNVKPEKVPSKR